ncbi:MAG: NAD(P)-binding domain-containing protein [Deltaproteobacteria bacterium]|nr:NAD(P)-binding domain-containing protein [Deltaproteobacteria bacterium]MBW2138068.1 NAD(P)-binding domain-containing protein [Deltaproteobacteria bacterium]
MGCSSADKVGFIGFGSMGSMLLEGFLSRKLLEPEEVCVSTRTEAKLSGLVQKWPKVGVFRSNSTVAGQSKTLFLCVKPLDMIPLLRDIKKELDRVCPHLVSIAASVEIGDIEALYQGRVSKAIPSLPSELGEGVSLVCHNGLVPRGDAEYVEDLFGALGRVVPIKEREFELAADLTSCAPGMIAAIFRNFVESALKHSQLDKEVAQEITIATLKGTARLLLERQMGFADLISRVATKGGITEEGVRVLDRGLPPVFDEVFERTLGKHRRVKRLVKDQLGQTE